MHQAVESLAFGLAAFVEGIGLGFSVLAAALALAFLLLAIGALNLQVATDLVSRAFTYLLPSGASFSIARAATIQSALDLYGANSAVGRAIAQAWEAVGVGPFE